MTTIWVFFGMRWPVDQVLVQVENVETAGLWGHIWRHEELCSQGLYQYPLTASLLFPLTFFVLQLCRDDG